MQKICIRSSTASAKLIFAENWAIIYGISVEIHKSIEYNNISFWDVRDPFII